MINAEQSGADCLYSTIFNFTGAIQRSVLQGRLLKISGNVFSTREVRYVGLCTVFNIHPQRG